MQNQLLQRGQLSILSFILLLMGATLHPLWAQDPDQKPKPDKVAVPIDTFVELNPANTSVSFVGVHVGEDPRPRLGGFAEFHGMVKVDIFNSTIKSIVFDIDVNSVFTEFTDLTAHLKNSEFFNVAEFPRSSFVSTKIEMAKHNRCWVTGDLTLLGQTKSIRILANYRFTDSGFLFSSDFSLDRSRFGMDQMLNGVDKTVKLRISIGEKTIILEERPGHGGESQKDQADDGSNTERQTVSLKLPQMT